MLSGWTLKRDYALDYYDQWKSRSMKDWSVLWKSMSHVGEDYWGLLCVTVCLYVSVCLSWHLLLFDVSLQCTCVSFNALSYHYKIIHPISINIIIIIITITNVHTSIRLYCCVTKCLSACVSVCVSVNALCNTRIVPPTLIRWPRQKLMV
jgi:hypothetical protein